MVATRPGRNDLRAHRERDGHGSGRPFVVGRAALLEMASGMAGPRKEEARMKLFHYGIVAIGLAFAMPASAQDTAATTNMEIFAAKVKADKKLVVAANMELTEAEAKAFWPIYEAYQADLKPINEKLLKTIADYADAYGKGPIPDETGKRLLGDTIAIEQSELTLKTSYIPKLEKVLPEAKVVRYIQIENKIRAMVRYEIASSIPLVK
jgi:hypothetical protein